MKQSSIGPFLAVALLAVPVAGCAADDSSDPSGGDRPSEGARIVGINASGGEEIAKPDSRERPVATTKGVIPKEGSCPGCGPLPDPWQEMGHAMGPLPDPWGPPDRTPKDTGSGGDNGGSSSPPKP